MAGNSKCKVRPHLVIAIGASAGGLREILHLVEKFPPDVNATMVIATHRESSTRNRLAELVSSRARVRVDVPEDEECLERTTIYVGRPDDRVEVDDDEFDVEVEAAPYARIRRIDDLFFSVAESAGPNAVGIILSGMLSDGVKGLKAISAAGGRCIVQAPEDAAYPSMPDHALDAVDVDFVGTTEEIASILFEWVIGRGIRPDNLDKD